MAALSTRALDLIAAGLTQDSSAEVGGALYRALEPFGVRALYARAYLSTASSTSGECLYSRISPPGWEALYAEKRFQDVNYLTREIRLRPAPFEWADIRLVSDGERALANALIDNGFPNGLAVPCHGPCGYVGVVSLAFERLHDIAPEDRRAIEFAALASHNRMRELSAVHEPRNRTLSRRERDCIGLIAQGMSDWDISVILGVAHTTIITHVQNAKRKLGARTRAQAVARCLTDGLL